MELRINLDAEGVELWDAVTARPEFHGRLSGHVLTKLLSHYMEYEEDHDELVESNERVRKMVQAEIGREKDIEMQSFIDALILVEGCK